MLKYLKNNINLLRTEMGRTKTNGTFGAENIIFEMKNASDGLNHRLDIEAS